MTILTKPSIILKKPDNSNAPLVLDNCVCEEEKVEIYPPRGPLLVRPEKSSAVLHFLTIIATLVVLSGFIWGLVLYRQYKGSSHRYTGFCSVPIDIREVLQQSQAADQLIEQNFREHRVMPLTWYSDPNFQVVATNDEDENIQIVNSLLEQFDIEDDVERIQVNDKGKMITFVHDFQDNITGIIDTDRCFVMELDPGVVVPPPLLLVGIESGGEFDVSRVTAALSAALPPLAAPPRALRRCQPRPVYRLHPVDDNDDDDDDEPVAIRKRSASEPKPDYIHFAGKHVQEIRIANLPALIAREGA